METATWSIPARVEGGRRTIVLVPGFWLGAWAWDEVAAALRADGHEVAALTLPGLESAEADRSAITMRDHVDAICEAIGAAGDPVVLAVHSGAGAWLRRERSRPRADRGDGVRRLRPREGALEPDFEGVEMPMPALDEPAKEENLDGLTAEHLETFRRRAVPEPEQCCVRRPS